MGGNAQLPLGSALDNEAEDELKGSKETDPREGAGQVQNRDIQMALDTFQSSVFPNLRLAVPIITCTCDTLASSCC